MMNAELVGLSREIALRRELDVIANNMANLNTTGFQGERVAFEDYMMPAAEATAFRTLDEDVAFVQDWATYRDLEPGARRPTGNALDVALSPGGYLTVETPEGIMYTRNGALQINQQGQLATMDGHPIISLGGIPILFNINDSDITITATGQVNTSGGNRGALQLVTFPNEQELEKVGSTMFRAPVEAEPDPTVQVSQGVLEASNVQPVREMARLIEVQRAYESQSNMLRQSNDMRQEAIRLLGRVDA
ncbi:MAG: flagellar hook-basal body complex protein [Devosiaceae bacterium]|nr:flagellar hook-basal body complex protein [Devosiaceae bacterium MH13]